MDVSQTCNLERKKSCSIHSLAKQASCQTLRDYCGSDTLECDYMWCFLYLSFLYTVPRASRLLNICPCCSWTAGQTTVYVYSYSHKNCVCVWVKNMVNTCTWYTILLYIQVGAFEVLCLRIAFIEITTAEYISLKLHSYLHMYTPVCANIKFCYSQVIFW